MHQEGHHSAVLCPALGPPNYRLAKELVHILFLLTDNPNSFVKSSAEFIYHIQYIYSELMSQFFTHDYCYYDKKQNIPIFKYPSNVLIYK